MGINNIHHDLTATAETPAKPNVLAGILKNPDNASYLIATPRTVEYRLQTLAKFLSTYDKREGVRPQKERVSKDDRKGTVKIWVRSYGDNQYLIETDENNIVE